MSKQDRQAAEDASATAWTIWWGDDDVGEPMRIDGSEFARKQADIAGKFASPVEAWESILSSCLRRRDRITRNIAAARLALRRGRP